MSEEFTIQCQSCGTYYNDLQEVCPYCSEPQPDLIEEVPPEQADYQEQPVYEPELPLDEPTALEEYAEEEQFSEDEQPPIETPFVNDDIFSIAGERDEEEVLEDDFEDYVDEHQIISDQVVFEEEYYDDEHFEQAEGNTVQSVITWRRIVIGCLGMMLCAGLLFGGIGLVAVREGLEERALIAQSESQAHFQKGQEHFANNSMELAIAEFEQALKLDPNFSEARQALREAQRVAQNQPTPTSQTRSAAASELLRRAETQIDEQNWTDAAETLSQVRDLDPDYRAEDVSEMLHTANYQLGLQFTTANQLEEALVAFENALTERPGDSLALAEQEKAVLYLDGLTLEESDTAEAVEIFRQLYQQDGSYLDIKQRLWRAYERYGDELVGAEEWCRAEAQYIEAQTLQTSTPLQSKITNSNARCQEASTSTRNVPQPTPRPTVAAVDIGATNVPQPTATITTTNLPGPAATGGGSIIFSAFNPNEAWWEIVSVPVRGGPPEVLVTEATMPAVSPNGQLLLYHTELVDTEGLHILDLTTGEDRRVTNVRGHILPRWSDNTQFIFTAQEAATGRWLVHQGFADAKSDPIIIRDGRTPDWSSTGSTIAYQGTDPAGNNPGIYLVPFGGGESTRLTSHESDRSPTFSPDGSQLAYMSTRNGNWDIYTVSTAGSAPRQITTATGNDGLPAWSPDGSQIGYVSDADGSWAIYVVNAAGGTPTKVTEWDGANRADWLMAQIWWVR